MSTNRQDTLKRLLRAIALSVGDFALLLARCNSIEVRDHLVADLKAQLGSGLYDRNIEKDGVINLVDILDEVGEGTQVISVTGLEASPHLHDILALANNAREEFRKRFKFPLVLWVTDEVESQLRRRSPDLASWAAPPFDFALDRAELQAMLERETADVLDWAFAAREGKRGIGQELQWAWQEWQRLEENRSPELAAKVALAFGIEAGSGDAAREHFENCLAQVNTGSLAAAARYRLGLWWQLRGKQERVNFWVNCDRAREQLQMAWHEPEGKRASVALALGEILLALALPETGNTSQWQALANFANELVILPDWAAGLRAEVAIARQDWQVAKAEAEKALQGHGQGFYLLSLGRSLMGMDRAKEAITPLEQAKALVLPEVDPDLHIRILQALHRAYTAVGNYRDAFTVKCDREAVETSYGFRAFIGAGRLQPKRRVGAIGEDITEEIAASGRQADIKNLVDRVKRDDCRLTVVHGYSGVGKSSLLQWGLVPALKNDIYRARHILPVVVEHYEDWQQELAKELVNSLKELADKSSPSLSYVEQQESNFVNNDLDASERLLSQLRRNDRQNLITVLIFDQFEEFFFKHGHVDSRSKFYEFLNKCLDTPYVWIILSLREDYVHYLLEYDRLYEKKENNVIIYSPDILKTDRRYPIGNFDRDRAKAVIKELTERSPYWLEEALIDRFVVDLAVESGEVRPIELQVVGAQMLHGDEKITTLAAYEALGNNPKQALVKRWLTQIVGDCGQENEDLAERVLYALTDEPEKRPAKTQTQIEKDVHLLSLPEDSETEGVKGDLDFVLKVPIGSGLAFKIPTKPEDCYQLIHDYLVPPIRQQFGVKLTQQLEEEKQKRKLAEDERDELLVYKSLEEERQKRELVEQELTKSQLNEERQRRELVEQELVGKKIVEQKNRLLSRSLFFSAIFATALGISSVFAFQKKGEADLRRKMANDYANNSQVVATSQTWQGLMDAGAFNIDSQVNTIYTFKNLKENFSDLTPDTQLILKATLNRAAYTSKEINRLEGHKDAIKSITVAGDGDDRRVLTGSFDKTAKLWTPDGKLIHSFGYGSEVSSVALSSDGTKVLIGSWDKSVTLWNLNKNVDKWEKSDLKFDEVTSKATSIAFSPNGQTFITASADGIARLWGVDSEQPIQSFNREGIVRSVAFSPDGKTVMTGSDDKTAKLWGLDGQLLQTFTGHDGAVISLAFSSDAKQVITGSEDQTAKLWNIENGQLLVTFKGYVEAVTNVAFGKKDKLVFTGSEKERTAKLWNADGRLIQTLRFFSYISSIAFDPDRNTVLTGSINNTVKVFDINQQRIISDSNNLVATNESNFNDSNNKMWLKITNNTVERRSLNDDKLVTTFRHSKEVTSAVFSPDGKSVLTSSKDKTAKLWNIDGRIIATFKGHKDDVIGAIFSSDGKTILTSSKDQTAKLWKLDGSLLQTFNGIDSRALSLNFSRDRQKILIGYEDGTARLWSSNGGKLLQTFFGHNGYVISAAFSPDGKTLLTGSNDNTAILWNLNNGDLLQTLQSHNDAVWSVAFSPDGKNILTGSADRTIKLWSIDIQNNTNNLLYTFQGHIDKVVSVAFDVDAQKNIKGIKSESADLMAMYWDLDPKTSLLAMCDQLRNFALGKDDPSIKGEQEKAKLRDRIRNACNIPPPKQ